MRVELLRSGRDSRIAREENGTPAVVIKPKKRRNPPPKPNGFPLCRALIYNVGRFFRESLNNASPSPDPFAAEARPETLRDGTTSGRLRGLPSVATVLDAPTAKVLLSRFGRKAATEAIRRALQAARVELSGGASVSVGPGEIAATALSILEADDRSSLRPVFNLTGTVLHTNLGRALLAEAAIEAAVGRHARSPWRWNSISRRASAASATIMSAALALRADRAPRTPRVVNNNAAAVLLALNTLAAGREAIVSRGELIEIGGAFRMPDIMARAGARLVEVGTTNRTHPKDYRDALGPRDRRSSSKSIRRTIASRASPPRSDAAELAAIARQAEVPLVHDLGSGTLVDLSRYGLEKEPTVREAVAEGADLVTFSGDKLLGGPQAGFIVGRARPDRRASTAIR